WPLSHSRGINRPAKWPGASPRVRRTTGTRAPGYRGTEEGIPCAGESALSEARQIPRAKRAVVSMLCSTLSGSRGIGVAESLAPLDEGLALLGREELRDDEELAPVEVFDVHTGSSR